jgi:uncharacterized lipoprotein YbaY
MKFAFSRARLGVASALAVSLCLTFSATAEDAFTNQGGISSPMLSRCAGKFGEEVRAADSAFPGLTLMGVPWMTIERTNQTVDGQHIVATVTGIGSHNRRRGEIAGLAFRCLINDKGDAASFTWRDLLPERNEALPPATVLHGTAYYQPKTPLAPGTELRAQLFDQAANPPALLTESVVRSSWVEPIPFELRVPPNMKLQGRKLVLDMRLALGAEVLFRLKQPKVLPLDTLQQPIDVSLEEVTGGSSVE